MLTEMKRTGYRVVLFFLWLADVDVAIARVKNRVRQGGHNVPENVIRRRFESGIRNFFHLYRPLADVWRLYDGSQLPPEVVAHEENQKLQVFHAELFAQIARDEKE